MSDAIFNVLFLCTGNTARSILAEGILRKDGADPFNAFPAGSQIKGTVKPYARAAAGLQRSPPLFAQPQSSLHIPCRFTALANWRHLRA